MKTIILTIATVASLIVGTANTTYATNRKDVQTTLSHVGNINKIEVRGNVEVYVTNGTKDAVTVNNNYYAESALIQDENGVLRISSYKTEKLVVYVTASDLRTISAYDNAEVKSDGRLAAIDLTINLYNNAYAGLTLDNYAANINVNDRAKADLAGTIVEYNLNYSNASTVNRAKLVATNTTENKIVEPRIAKQLKPELADDLVVVL